MVEQNENKILFENHMDREIKLVVKRKHGIFVLIGTIDMVTALHIRFTPRKHSESCLIAVSEIVSVREND